MKTALPASAFLVLEKSILFLKMGELRKICVQFNLTEKGKKLALIDRILSYLKYGEKKEQRPFPEKSRARKGEKYSLTPTTLILKNAHKNDLATRKFMKTLVGEHFHFTAYGIDWIEDQWYAGKAPTYRQFAEFWQREYQAREKHKTPPKKEWAYINFVQTYLQSHSNANKGEILKAWNIERNRHVEVVTTLLLGQS